MPEWQVELHCFGGFVVAQHYGLNDGIDTSGAVAIPGSFTRLLAPELIHGG